MSLLCYVSIPSLLWYVWTVEIFLPLPSLLWYVWTVEVCLPLPSLFFNILRLCFRHFSFSFWRLSEKMDRLSFGLSTWYHKHGFLDIYLFYKNPYFMPVDVSHLAAYPWLCGHSRSHNSEQSPALSLIQRYKVLCPAIIGFAHNIFVTNFDIYLP